MKGLLVFNRSKREGERLSVRENLSGIAIFGKREAILLLLELFTVLLCGMTASLKYTVSISILAVLRLP